MWAALLVLTGCGSSTPTPPPADPEVAPMEAVAPEEAPAAPPAGVLLFTSERDGAPRLFRVGTDGTGERAVDGPPGALFPAAVDPRGEAALAIATRDDESGHAEQLWLLPVDGGEGRALTPLAGKVRNPSWGPGGDWLVFASDAMSYRDLFRVARDGSGLERLTEAPHGSFEPEVSADGSRIAFGTSRDGNAEIYTMKSDGTDPVRVTRNPADDLRPRWSPDGRTLAWASLRDGPAAVYTVTAGGQPKRLRPAEGRTVDLDHAWSPDGSHLAITVQTGPKAVQIDVVAVASGQTIATLDGPGPDEQPSWSPDGGWLAFSSSRSGEPAIYAVRRDGSALRRVSSGQTDWLPRWMAP